MANIIDTLTARIEERRLETREPCKNYGTKDAAEKATMAMAQKAANYFHNNPREVQEGKVPSADYVVFYVESWGRWVGCINLSELLRRSTSTGGYLGICTGFYTW